MAGNGAAEVRIAMADIPLGGMAQAGTDEGKVLFVRDAEGVRAFQATCPHYGAPLAKGMICGDTLYCPWHKAAFAIRDGTLREPPALNDLKRFPVRIEGSDAVASLQAIERTPPARAVADRHVVIVGTGAAAVAAATTLRRDGFAGRLTMVGREMIGREAAQPYDRPKLSKNFLAKKTPPSAMQLEPDFYRDLDVEPVAGAATRIDPATRSVTLADGRSITGDALLIATGSRATRPSFPGDDLGRVFTLRSLDDAVAISDAAEGAKTVVSIGGGFIGLEAAAFLTKRGLQATVVAPHELPFAKRFGDDVGRAIRAQHEKNGVRFLTGTVARFEGDGVVAAVHLEDGTVLPADLVVIGAGAAPETEAVVGVAKREDGGIPVGADLMIAPGVWIAGDIAAFPEARAGTTARIEHWRLAEQHGIHAARAMLGRSEPFTAAPFFWSNQGDKRVDYAGYAPDWDEIVTRGDPAALDFISYYVKDGVALAACSVGQNEKMIAFLNRLETGQAARVSELPQA